MESETVTPSAPGSARLGAGFAAILFLLALLPRIAIVLMQPDGFHAVSEGNDCRFYLGIAERLAAGEPAFTLTWPPGLPLLLGGLFAVFGYSVPLAHVVVILLSALQTVLIGMLCARLLGRGWGRIGGLVAAVHGYLIYETGRIMAEPLFGVLTVTAVLLFAAERPREWVRILLLGGLLGYASLVRTGGLLLCLVFGVAVLLSHLRRDGPFLLRARRAVAAGALLTLAALVFIVPYCYRNYRATDGEFFGIQCHGGHLLLISNNPEVVKMGGGCTDLDHTGLIPPCEVESRKEENRLAINKKARAVAVQWMKENPSEVLYLVGRKLLNFLGFYWSFSTMSLVARAATVQFWVILALALVGTVAMLRFGAGPGWAWLPLAILGISLVPVVIFYGSPRFRNPVEFVFILHACYGARFLFSRRT